jgi:hypothetical protein
MQHLDAEKLSAHLDNALTGSARAEVERHLEACPECRTALAEMLALDEGLDVALTHEPGDAYFETFAARVEDRIRAAGLRGAQERQNRARGPGLWSWWTSPRRLAVTSAVAATVVGIGVVLLVARETPPGVHGDRLMRRAAPPAAEAPLATNRPGTPSASAPDRRLDQRARDKESSDRMAEMHTEPSAPVPSGGGATPSRAYEVRDERGEVVRVPSGANTSRFASPPSAPQPTGNKLQKPAAAPMAQVQEEVKMKESNERQSASANEADALSKKDAANVQVRPQSAPPAAAQAPTLAQETATDGKATSAVGAARSLGVVAPKTEGGQPMLCGDVMDTNGRPIANAEISLVDLSRVTKTNDKGLFCIPAPAGSQALVVMAVGFKPSRLQVVVAGEAPTVRVTLQSVSAIGGGLALTPNTRSDSLAAHNTWGTVATTDRDAKREASAAKSIQEAEAAWSQGIEQHSASRLDAAAGDFERALKSLDEGAQAQAVRYRLAQTRVEAWRMAPSGRRTRAAQSALNALITQPATTAARDSAARWMEQIRH